MTESVEIPRTPKQQFTRKRLQLASFTDPEDKETDEIEGVTSLVMYPDLVDNKVTFFGLLNSVSVGLSVCDFSDFFIILAQIDEQITNLFKRSLRSSDPQANIYV